MVLGKQLNNIILWTKVKISQPFLNIPFNAYLSSFYIPLNSLITCTVIIIMIIMKGVGWWSGERGCTCFDLSFVSVTLICKYALFTHFHKCIPDPDILFVFWRHQHSVQPEIAFIFLLHMWSAVYSCFMIWQRRAGWWPPSCGQ